MTRHYSFALRFLSLVAAIVIGTSLATLATAHVRLHGGTQPILTVLLYIGIPIILSWAYRQADASASVRIGVNTVFALIYVPATLLLNEQISGGAKMAGWSTSGWLPLVLLLLSLALPWTADLTNWIHNGSLHRLATRYARITYAGKHHRPQV